MSEKKRMLELTGLSEKAQMGKGREERRQRQLTCEKL
jgi:hypothetical protein